MAPFTNKDLISLADSDDNSEGFNITNSVLPSSTTKTDMKRGGSSSQSDSFAGLANLMKAKKPYTPTSSPFARPPQARPRTSEDIFPAASACDGSSITSPLAQSHPALGSVAEFLREQEMLSATPLSEHRFIYQPLLESFIAQNDESSIYDSTNWRSPPPPSPLPLSTFQSLSTSGPIKPPTPAASTKSDIVVRLTQASWDSISKNLGDLTKEKQTLESKVAKLEHKVETLQNRNELAPQFGGLCVRNDISQIQRAEMNQSLAKKDIEIEHLNNKLADLQMKSATYQEERNDADSYRTAMEEQINKLNEELRSLASQQTAPEVLRLANILSDREKFIQDLRQEVLEQQMKGLELEEEVDRLRERAKQEDIDMVKCQLQNKVRQCDSYRSNLKKTELQLKNVQKNFADFMDRDGRKVLMGGAHLVVPDNRTKLPAKVVACSECYATNNKCDNGARCQRCVDGSKKCARWRCSLKHKLGECPMAPCLMTHDSQGWLMLPAARPDW